MNCRGSVASSSGGGTARAPVLAHVHFRPMPARFDGIEPPVHLENLAAVRHPDAPPLHVRNPSDFFEIRFGLVHPADLVEVAVGDDDSASVGHHQVNDIGLSGRLGEQVLELEFAHHPPAHAGAGPGFEGADQRGAFLGEQPHGVFLLPVDVLDRQDRKDRHQDDGDPQVNEARNPGPQPADFRCCLHEAPTSNSGASIKVNFFCLSKAVLQDGNCVELGGGQ